MRVLIIDNNIDPDSWGAAPLRRHSQLAPGATFYVRRAPERDLPRGEHLASFDRVIVSGSKTSALDQSEWTSELEETLRRIIDLGRPLLGVCYGQQIITRALEGISSVRRAKTPELGWTRVEIVRADRIFKGLPATFSTFQSHFDEITRLPKGAIQLATSEHCTHQAYALADKPVFCVQFHPEKNVADAENTFSALQRMGVREFTQRDAGKRLYDPTIGETIFKNFFEVRA